MCHAVLAVVSNCCPPLKGRFLTRYSPVRHCPLLQLDESSFRRFSFDLHVLSTPPAFVLSQDQTLHDRSFVWLDYFLPCSNSLLGIATSHIGLIRSLYCSVFKEPSLFKRLDYLTTFVEVCQMIFLKSFSSLFRTGPLHQRRVLSYHTALLMSTAFFMFFCLGAELVRHYGWYGAKASQFF